MRFSALLWQQELFPGVNELWGLFLLTLSGGSFPSLEFPRHHENVRETPQISGLLFLQLFPCWPSFLGAHQSSFSVPTQENLGSVWTLPPSPKVCKLSQGNSRAHLTFSWDSGIAVPGCLVSYVLNTIVSYILSGFLALPCRRIKMVPVTPYWLGKNHLCMLDKSNASLFSRHLLKCRNVPLCSKWP